MRVREHGNGFTHRVTVQKITGVNGDRTVTEDFLAVEEPLEIRLDFERDSRRQQKSISITMRTPGHDLELAAGFLWTEGILSRAEDILEISHCGPVQPQIGTSNVVKVRLCSTRSFDMKSLERHFYTSSSCGVCGKSSLEALRVSSPYTAVPKSEDFQISPDVIHSLPQRLRQAQEIFERTGGLHASALFSTEGDLLSIREDVGRHNALDKVIGQALLAGELPLTRAVLMLSGRVSFELVQKAAMAGIRMLTAVGAPSSLSLALAEEVGMTLIGFVREERFNIYAGAGRIRL